MANLYYHTSNIFDLDAHALVNPVNCVGVMGAGLAKEFARRYPKIVAPYQKACATNKLRPGKVFVITLSSNSATYSEKYVVCFPTKDNWREPSELSFIKYGLLDLVDVIESLNIRSIAIPKLGCGLGGLKWGDVRPLIESALNPIENFDVHIFQ